MDTNGNVVSFFYGTETNYYARNNDATRVTQYVRAGYPTRIEYGSRTGSENGNDPASVVFTVANRCAAQANCPSATPTYKEEYPDVPMDLMCTSPTTACSGPGHDSPSFFSTKQITSITTRVGSSDVSTVSMDYSFPPTSDATTPSLWLRTITRTGKGGTSPDVALPPVRFTGVLLPNRVDHDAAGGVPPANKYRVGVVQTELGGRTTVTYDDPYPCSRTALPQWDLNETDCFPQWFKPDGAPSGVGVFRKYLVTQLTTDDTTGPSPSQVTEYDYVDKPAWHYDNSPLTPASQQSWADYRGHADVRVIGDPTGATARTETRHQTFRGMNGDKLVNGGIRDASLLDSTGTRVPDDHYYQGYPLEERHIALGGVHYASEIHRYWRTATIDGPAGFPRHDTVYVRESSLLKRVKDTSSSLETVRTHQVDTGYDVDYATPNRRTDRGDLAVTGDESCVWVDSQPRVVSSASPTNAAWLVAHPFRTTTFESATCGGTAPIVAKSESLYDGNTTVGAAPLRGNITQVRSFSNATTKAITSTGYDAYGRVTSTTSPRGATTTTEYEPPTGYPTLGVKTVGHLGHTTVTKHRPEWGVPSSVVDQNSHTTALTYDALGRALTVHHPDDAATTPSIKYAYALSQTSPTNVSTRRLLDGSRYVVSGIYVDSLGRTIQTETHEPNGWPGRQVSQTRYDAQGRVLAETEPWVDGGTLGSGVVNVATTTIPNETRYAYDSRGLPSLTAQYAYGVSQWSTATRHYGSWDQVVPPVRSPIDYRNDVWGRVWKVTERPASGTSDTTYGYTALGDLATVTDDAANTTSHSYDWLRRRVRSVDPDAGTWLLGYDLDGHLTTTTDGNGTVVLDDYDLLGRRTGRGTPQGMTDTWMYDSAPGGVGYLAKSVRHSDGTNSYGTTIAGYDARGRVTGKVVNIVDGPSTLTGDYAYSYRYDSSDNLTAVTYPAGGGLAQETVTTAYNAAGRPTSMEGDSAYGARYLDTTAYAFDGQVEYRTMRPGAIELVREYYHEPAARRIRKRPQHGPAPWGGDEPCGRGHDVRLRRRQQPDGRRRRGGTCHEHRDRATAVRMLLLRPAGPAHPGVHHSPRLPWGVSGSHRGSRAL